MAVMLLVQENKKNMETMAEKLERVSGKQVMNDKDSVTNIHHLNKQTGLVRSVAAGTLFVAGHARDPLGRLKHRLLFKGDHSRSKKHASSEWKQFGASYSGAGDVQHETPCPEALQTNDVEPYVPSVVHVPVDTPLIDLTTGEGTVSFFTLLSMAAEGVVEIESYIPQCDIPDYVKQHDYATEQMDYMIAPAEMPVTTGTQEQTVKTEPENHGCSFDTYVSINTISFRKLYSNFLAERFFRSMTRDTDIGSLSRTFVAISHPLVAIVPGIGLKEEMTGRSELQKDTFAVISRLYNEVEGNSIFAKRNPYWPGTFYFPPQFADIVIEEDGCPPSRRVENMLKLKKNSNNPMDCSRFVVPHFLENEEIWASYTFDVERKIVFMVDPTLLYVRSIEERHADIASLILRGLHYCMKYVWCLPSWSAEDDWTFQGTFHGRDTLR
ncbi:uncharacterized protein LOC112270546 [Brachypodium distachyon]|uniref:uncharacterized protein LOC112270546 n=1 Tax=Brachypodium distachyon TaxID=15368 RepID=UPI000D0CA04D|nr:uncharacterized protein LOC112270546 [Brachypodium distachyon]|eukprot:XP_024313962.1 uncharacterized protein LOC112270546 [Brachypodium distachyon]